ITTASGEKYYLLSPEEYLSHVKSTFFGRKRKHLLAEDVPEDFVSRQLNDTRYIGKKLTELLYPVANSDIIFTSGSITSDLRKQWGLINVWKEILLPRFKRLEDAAGIALVENGENNETHFLKDYKRVDHRHHALDALVVAATHRSHIQYLNSLNSFQNKREEMQKFFYLLRSKTREFKLPWHSFTKDTKDALQEIFVSHKANNRFLTKRANKYYKWVKEKHGWKKEKCKQVTGEIFSPRVSLFKEPLGLVNIAEYKNMTTGKAIEIQFKYLTEFKNRLQSRIADPRLREKVNHLIKNCSFDLNETMKFLKKHPLIDDKKQPIKQITVLQFNEYSAKRTPLDKTITIKKIDNIPYSGHSKLAETLRAHLNEYNGDSAEAFSGEGLKILYQKWGRPIKKITRLESVGSKINLNGKLLEADTNLFFAIYENIETGKRDYETLPLLDIINRRMNRLPVTDEREGYKTILLSPNDIVYVPSPEENVNLIDWDDKKKISKRLYRVVSFSGKRCYFLPQSVADLIITHQTNPGKGEFSTQNKDEKSIEGIKIVDVCFKIRIDRLGNLIK
ncbi:MAG: hypothetical protein GYA14_09545, partial [Ignavibacteria bacterium]|nr:hypothetical protein [Ignavibacteria bacterium]